jgi:hypothetical protein
MMIATFGYHKIDPKAKKKKKKKEKTLRRRT